MKQSIIGSVLLIIGTCLGGGMLALPLVTSAAGFGHALLLFVLIWLLSLFCAYLVLEICLWCPAGTHLISMAAITFGRWGYYLAWVVYLAFLYTLLSAYIAGGSDLFMQLTAHLGLHWSVYANTLIFLILFSCVLYHDISAVDWVNRALMLVKMSAFVLLIGLMLPNTQHRYLVGGHWSALPEATIVMITSFGFSIIIPSLRRYFGQDMAGLRKTIWLGGTLALFCYVLWDFVIQGHVPAAGPSGLTHIAHHPHAVSRLTQTLATLTQRPLISSCIRLFTAICVTTSFLSITLCLADFLTDGLQLKSRTGWPRIAVLMLTVGPPGLWVCIQPGAFIHALQYAGISCVILMLILPIFMAYRGRYVLKLPSNYQVVGGLPLLALAAIASVIVLAIGLKQLL